MNIKFSLLLALCFSSACAVALANPLVYFAANSPTSQFGVLDLSTGNYSVIGPLAGGSTGMTFGPGGPLYNVTYPNVNSLVTINPTDASTTTIGSTGGAAGSLAFGGNSAGLFGVFFESISSTSNAFNYYTINAGTGARSFVGQSLSYSYDPSHSNPGAWDVSSGSSTEYAFVEIYDATVGSFIISPGLYSLNPGTGAATLIGPTGVDDIVALVDAGGQLYGITTPAIGTSGPSIYRLNTSTGAATFVANVAPGIDTIYGAAAVPEPATLALLCLGLAGLGFSRRRKHT